jgi:predicted AlkP superfamily phosphohydrolase/phosphomutase
MPKKLAVIGLDCLTPQFLYGGGLDGMPNFKRLIEGSLWGNLVSIVPPITVPAWTSMMTSQDPGMLGIYGFRNRKSYAYEELYTVNASNVKAKTVWNYLSRNRLRSILLGVPQTYPPMPLNGVLVADFLTPGKESTFTYPPGLKEEIDRVADGEYIIDVKDFRTDDKKSLLEQIYVMTERRFKVFRHLLAREDWDFAMMVEMGPDRIHHAFWRFCDPSHRLYVKGNEYEDVIRRYYARLDLEIGRVLEALPSDASVIVVSDHGAKAMRGGICINEFFIREGLLAVKEYPKRPVSLTPAMIDWRKTAAWGEGGYYARVFLNVAGRESEGTVPRAEYERVRADVKRRLEGLADENGTNIGTRVFYPEEIYRRCENIPPDLIVYLGDLDWRSAGSVGHGAIHIFENATGPDDANHAQEGIFIWHNRGGAGRVTSSPAGDKISIYDVAPSILDFFSIEVPPDMIGRVV